VHKKVLIIGTTPDYIQWIRISCKDRAVFITDPVLRQASFEPVPDPWEEILTPLSDAGQVFEQLKKHLEKWPHTIDSIFCFDCESMALTAVIAEQLNLDYASGQTIQNCRDKYVSKQIWQHHGIKCPVVCPINGVQDVLAFFKTTRSGCVLKPLTGSGSELVFKCTTILECRSAFHAVQTGLTKRGLNPLFQRSSSKEVLLLAEERIVGTEYSCDFIVDKDGVQIIRLAKKITSPFRPFGTILGYVIPACLPQGLDKNDFLQILFNSATSLGIERGLCMIDFIVSDNQIVLIELTPRPGGDCLPHLLKACANLDILKLSLDFAQHHPMDLSTTQWPSAYVGIRLHAGHSGVLRKIDASRLLEDKRVKQIHLSKRPGHRIKLPPDDYDSWNLGHIIIEPSGNKFPESQAITLSKKIEIFIDPDGSEMS